MHAKKLISYTLIIVVLLLCAFFWQGRRVVQEQSRSPEDKTEALLSEKQIEQYKEPLPGKKGNLTASELAWVLRERLSLGVLSDMTGGQRGIKAYNERTSRYNEIAGSFEYLESDMISALLFVENNKEAILSEAVNDALAANNMIWNAQQLLRLRGLYLSSPTGRMNGDTGYAVKTYQLQRREPQTGVVDKNLLSALAADYLREKAKEEVAF